MNRTILLSLLCFCCIIDLTGQLENSNWHFGCGVGIAFDNDNTIRQIPSSTGVREGTVSVSDGSGQLLFYSDGNNIYDPDGTVTVTNLLGSGSSTTAIVAAPVAGSPNEYWLFTTTRLDETGGMNQYRYDFVRKTITEGPILLVSEQTEKLAISYRCEEQKYWLATQDRSGNFLIFSVAETVSLQATIPSTPSPISRLQTVGYLKFSEDARYLAVALPEVTNGQRGGEVKIYNFSQETGQIDNPSSPIILSFNEDGQGNYIGNPYGLQFSPSGRFLYVSLSANDNSPLEGGELYQYDLEAASPNDSRTMIGKADQATLVYGSLQLGPDDKIYLAMETAADPTYACGCFGTYPFLGVINSPDMPGAGVDFAQDGLALTGGLFTDDCNLTDERGSKLGLPSFISGRYIRPRQEFPASRTICQADSVRLLPGSPQPGFNYMITGPGFISDDFFTVVAPDVSTTYVVRATSGNCGEVTQEVRIEVVPEETISIAGDTVLCAEGDLQLIANTSGGATAGTYTWTLPNGSMVTGQELNLEDALPGNYQVSFESEDRCVAVSAMVVINEDTNPPPPFTILATTENGEELPSGSQVMGGTVVTLTTSGLPSDENWTYSWMGNLTPATGNESSLRVIIPTLPGQIGGNLEYTLMVGTEGGSSCTADASILLLRIPGSYKIPELITPNGDGTNDAFRLFHNGVVQNFRLIIFNRWGQKVFTTTDPDAAWDGTINGTPQNTDSYLYLMTFTFEGIQREEGGQFSLIR